MEDLRKGRINFNGHDIRLIVIGDDAFIPKDKLTIPSKNENGQYVDGKGAIYFGKNDELDSGGKKAIPFNAYDGYPINETWRTNLHLPIALVLGQEFDEGEMRIFSSRATTLNITFKETEIKKQVENKDFAVWTAVDNKQKKLDELCKKLDIAYQNVLYVDNGLNPENAGDKFILNNVGTVVCSESNKKYNKLNLGKRLIKVDAGGGKGLIRAFSDEHVLPLVDKKSNAGVLNKNVVPKPIHRKQVKALIFDIDGTCTDNMKIYSTDGNEFKKFSLADIQAIRRCINDGYKVAFITGDETKIPANFVDYICEWTKSSPVKIDAKKYKKDCGRNFREWLGSEFTKSDSEKTGFSNVVPLIIGSGSKKAEIVEVVAEKFGIGLSEVAYMGDEDNEMGIAKKVISSGGVVACPSSSIEALKKVPGIKVLKNKGGQGNIKEFIDKVLLRLNTRVCPCPTFSSVSKWVKGLSFRGLFC